MSGCNNLRKEAEHFVREFDTEYLRKKAELTPEERTGYITAMSYYSEDIICPLHDQADILIEIRRIVQKGTRA